MGDFNEVVGASMSGFAKITTEFGLTNVFGHFHSIQTEDSTYACGPHQPDYIFFSQSLLPAVTACGAEPFNHHIFSYHRALSSLCGLE
jgi:hypothetical protein